MKMPEYTKPVPAVLEVLFVTHDHWRDELGGSDRSLLNLVEGLSGRGLRMAALVSCEGKLSTELEKRGVICFSIPYCNSTHRAQSHEGPKETGLMKLRLARNSIWGAIAKLKIRRLIRSRGVRIVYSNSSVIDIGYRTASSLGLPHIWHIREHPQAQWGIEPIVGWATYRKWFKRCAAVIAISEFVKEEVVGLDGAGNVKVIYNGVGWRSELMGHFNERAVRKRAGTTFRFGMVGAVHSFKGQNVALRAMIRVREMGYDVELVVAGDGELPWLRDLVKMADAEDYVHLLGRVQSCWSVWNEVDAGLMCSECEPMGRVTVEAMAAGVPVIGRDSGATPELIQDGVIGLLYDGSEEDLIAKMLLLARDPALAKSLGERASEYAIDRFSTESYADSVFTIITEVLDRDKSAV
jgi:glycosyltransferase involved in cell wall biosynthesis